MSPTQEFQNDASRPDDNSSRPVRVSLIIRYSRPQTIGKALDSVLAQRWGSGPVAVEVILIDTSGTNLIPPELSAYGLSSDPQIHRTTIEQYTLRWVTRHRQLPRPEALQAGIDEARADLTMFLDDDDTLDPEHMEKLHLGFWRTKGTNKDLVAVTTGVRFVKLQPDSNEAVTLHTWDCNLRPERLLLGNQLPLISFAALTQVLRNYRIDTTLKIFEDWDLILALSSRGSVVHLPGVTANYFHNSTGSGVHDPDVADPVAQHVRMKWIDHFRAADFSRIAEDLLLADQSISERETLLSRLAQTEAKLQDAEHALTRAKDQLTETQARLRLIETSRSWRLTAPLRNLKKRFSRDDI